MEIQKNSYSCNCDLKLGVDEISTQDLENSKKHKLANEAILFLGASNSLERCKIENKINEIRNKIGEFYFSKENKLIAIPNQIPLPKKPLTLDPDETDDKKVKKNNIYIDQYYEDILHQSIINKLNKDKVHSFVMRGFHSGDCMKAKLEKSKNLRKEQQCKCKTGKVCTCKGNKYPDLNIHEKEIMEILEIKDIDVDELKVCTKWLKSLKKLEEVDSKVSSGMIQPDIQSWLLDKVI